MAKRTVNMEPEVVAPALIDAINIFCRDVLVPRGYLRKEDWEDDALVEPKYAVARRVAESWRSVVVDDDAPSEPNTPRS